MTSKITKKAFHVPPPPPGRRSDSRITPERTRSGFPSPFSPQQSWRLPLRLRLRLMSLQVKAQDSQWERQAILRQKIR